MKAKNMPNLGDFDTMKFLAEVDVEEAHKKLLKARYMVMKYERVEAQCRQVLANIIAEEYRRREEEEAKYAA
ncbi:hypothetical protein [Alloscardovia macacae]|uniref:Uncharacterized protein n=1 Tax=Alloscardovia macacae TaxID=1160091 RepID=A0A261F4U3_9BIFI|nr:hypothetical protein [Alloscardovia macacae]OZG54063.1 hypothetical protein ALMA_1027 [Alloscardovia macacae]